MAKIKESKYNYNLNFDDKVICLNGVSNTMLLFRKNEYEHIFKELILKDDFQNNYPTLSAKLLQFGFLVENFEEELDQIRFQHNLNIFGSGPFWITINPTLDCNLKCWYCEINKSNIHSGKRMLDDVQKKVNFFIENIVYEKKAPGIHLDWFGGEPLLYFYQVMKPISTHTLNLTKKTSIKYSSHVTTNGLLINKKMINDFKNINLNSFQITLDGNEQKHNKIRGLKGESSFYQIVNNINLLCDLIDDVKITLRINYDKNTLNDIDKLTEHFTEKSRKKILVDFQRVWQVKQVKDAENNLLKNAIKIFSSQGYKISTYGFKAGKNYACYADRLNNISINYDGKVYKCTAGGYQTENSIGYLSESGNLVITNKKLYNMWFSKLNIDNHNCISCSYLPICNGICGQKKVDIRRGKLDFNNACLKKTSEINVNSFLLNEARNRGLIC